MEKKDQSIRFSKSQVRMIKSYRRKLENVLDMRLPALSDAVMFLIANSDQIKVTKAKVGTHGQS